MALVFVLWVMTILCAVALELGFSSHLRLQVTASTGGAAKAFFLARAGVEKAVADLVESRDRVQSQADLREDDTRTYQNVELGEGSYTLCAGMDEDGELVYGIADEAAKINVNTATAEVLARVPGMDADLAAEIAALKAREERLHDLNDLLLSERIDLLTLYGEDQNGNGILDPNENDGDQSWPPDNADGWLDGGLAVYLTTWSATRNVTSDGSERINLNSASAKEIVKSVTGVTDQEAESIVAHREKNKFASIADLLDVELVVKVTEQPKEKADKQAKTPEKPERKAPEQARTAKKPESSSEGGGAPSQQPNKPKKAESRDKKKPQTTVKGTGQKAFDMKKFRQIADQVTTQNEDVINGVVNINTAPAEVLACLPGLDDALARRIAGWRQGHAAGFETAADLLDIEGVSMDIFKQVCPLVSARSDVFSVRSFGVVGVGNMYCCVSAVIDRTGDTAKILYWRELE